MGFYLRKSFKAGPIRLNLSKRGLGFSVGVPGARIGVAATGRAYVSGGRGGIYFRENLGGSSRTNVDRPDVGVSQTDDDPLTIGEETGVTFPGDQAPSSSIPPLTSTLARKKLSVVKYLLMPVCGFALAVILASNTQLSPAVSSAGTVLVSALLAIWPIPMILTAVKNRRGSRLGSKLEARFSTLAPLDPAEVSEFRVAIDDVRITASDRNYYGKVSYLGLVRAVVTDGTVTADELALLGQAEDMCHLDPGFRTQARVDVFRRVYLEAVADHELEEDEDTVLKHVRSALDISDGEVSSELAFVDRLREIRTILEGNLTSAECSVPLPDDETCYHQQPARLLKERVLKSFQSGGQKYKVRGLVVEKAGMLIITNKRLLLVHDGTTSIPLKKILHVLLDYDRNLLAITKDGVNAAVYITTPEAHRASAVISTLAQGRSPEQ